MNKTLLLLLVLGLACGDDSDTSDATTMADTTTDVRSPDVDEDVESDAGDMESADMEDAGPPPEYSDVPERDIVVDRSDEALRHFDYAIEELDPEATSQPRNYFSMTRATAMLDTACSRFPTSTTRAGTTPTTNVITTGLGPCSAWTPMAPSSSSMRANRPTS